MITIILDVYNDTDVKKAVRELQVILKDMTRQCGKVEATNQDVYSENSEGNLTKLGVVKILTKGDSYK